MPFNSVSNIESCYIELPRLLYYSHIPALIIALFMGIFVYLKSKALASKILFAMAAMFSLWCVGNLITWIAHDSRLIMFAWSLLNVLDVLFFVLSLYFVYVFIGKGVGGNSLLLKIRHLIFPKT